jgi:hypothetical protein
MYGSDGSPRFVNGVLGNLIDHLEEIKLSVEIIQDEDTNE